MFTKESFCTPYYYLFSVLAKVDGILVRGEQDYFIVQGKGRYYLGLFRQNTESGLRVHLACGKNTMAPIIKHTFGKRHSCFASIKLLEGLDLNEGNIKEIIEKISTGEVEILTADRHDHSNFDFETDVLPGSFLLLEIPIGRGE